MYTQSLLHLASKADQPSFFEEPAADTETTKERTNSCQEDQLTQFEPLDMGHPQAQCHNQLIFSSKSDHFAEASDHAAHQRTSESEGSATEFN